MRKMLSTLFVSNNKKLLLFACSSPSLNRFLLIVINVTLLLNLSYRTTRVFAAPNQYHRADNTQHTPATPSLTIAFQHEHYEQQNSTTTTQKPHLSPHSTSAPNHYHQNQQHKAKLTLASNVRETNALQYLQKYGYMQAPANNYETLNLVSEDSFGNAVRDFQRFAGLPETGLVDNQTLEYMKLPRCGNSDKWRPATEQQLVRKQLGEQFHRLSLANNNNNNNTTTTQVRLVAAAAGKRSKRYALQGSKWRRRELTYRISQYPQRFNGHRHDVDAQISKAFGIWSQVAPIDFVVKKEGRVHIDIRFASGDHGDGDAFDGPGNTLAHAYFPQYGGDAHFDDQEYWTIDSYAGTNIFQVAAHELGHSLGLGHSNVREALMAPFYQKYKPHFKLHVDDILAIQALYGEKALQSDEEMMGSATQAPSTTTSSTTSTTTTTTTTTTTSTTRRPIVTRVPIYRDINVVTSRRPLVGEPTDNTGAREEVPATPDLSTNELGGDAGDLPDLCSDSAIDTITRTEDGSTYVFKGDFYWLLMPDGPVRGYPRRISTDWDGLPGQLDAALTWADGKTFFFKGNKYWRFRNKRRDVGYPKLISAGFAGIPDDIDAAFVWSGNGRTYFFKGTEYWRFDSKSEPPVSSEYPRPIKVWLGVPSYVNAAFKWENNVTYFFKGQQYYRFNDKEFRAETRGRPAFPRNSGEWWFGCVSNNLAAQRALHSGSLKVDTQSGGPPTPDSALGSDWSFLAGSSADSTRPLGTHINDHKPLAPSAFNGNQQDNTSLPTPVADNYAGEHDDGLSYYHTTRQEHHEIQEPHANHEQHEHAISGSSPHLSAASTSQRHPFVATNTQQASKIGFLEPGAARASSGAVSSGGWPQCLVVMQFVTILSLLLLV